MCLPRGARRDCWTYAVGQTLTKTYKYLNATTNRGYSGAKYPSSKPFNISEIDLTLSIEDQHSAATNDD